MITKPFILWHSSLSPRTILGNCGFVTSMMCWCYIYPTLMCCIPPPILSIYPTYTAGSVGMSAHVRPSQSRCHSNSLQVALRQVYFIGWTASVTTCCSLPPVVCYCSLSFSNFYTDLSWNCIIMITCEWIKCCHLYFYYTGN